MPTSHTDIYLFVDTISLPHTLVLFSDVRKIIEIKQWDGSMREFELLNEHISNLLGNHNMHHKDLHGIVCITGPWGFTGTRITTLVCNTLHAVWGTPLYGLSLIQALILSGATWPFLIEISKKECLIQNKWDTTPTIIPTSELTKNTYYGSCKSSTCIIGDSSVIWVDHKTLIDTLSLGNFIQEHIQPYYAKDPNITLSKKHDLQPNTIKA